MLHNIICTRFLGAWRILNSAHVISFVKNQGDKALSFWDFLKKKGCKCQVSSSTMGCQIFSKSLAKVYSSML